MLRVTMASNNEEYYVNGTPISDLRVVDLKEQLEKRGLSKSGNKSVLLKRLKDHLALEKLQAEQMGKDPDAAPNMEMKTCGNDLVAEYLEKQQQMLQAARMATGRPQCDPITSLDSSPSLAMETPSSTAVTVVDAENRLASPPSLKRASTRGKSPRTSRSEHHDGGGVVSTAASPGSSSIPISTTPTEHSEISVPNEPTASEVKTSPEPPSTTAASLEEVSESTWTSQVVNASATDPELLQHDQGGVGQVERPPSATTAPETPSRSANSTIAIQAKSTATSAGLPVAADDNTNVETVVEDMAIVDHTVQDDADGATAGGIDEGQEEEKERTEHQETTVMPVELDDVEMEISAPINAADQILEAANTVPTPSRSEDAGSLELATTTSQDIPQRKRKWVASTRTARTPVSISSDSLKEIVGPMDEGTKEDIQTAETAEMPTAPKRIVISRDASRDSSEIRTESETQRDRRVEIAVVEASQKVTEDGLVRGKSPSPPRHPRSSIIHIRGLTRPFTLQSLHELLSKYGNFIREDFWIDNIKSHCIVKYSSEEEAALARERLHDVHWPSAYNRMLRVDFATQEDLDRHRSPDGNASRGDLISGREPGSGRAVDQRLAGYRDSRGAALDGDRARHGHSGESPPIDPRGANGRRQGDVKMDQPAKSGMVLDELFRKTKATPCIYWLPLTEEGIKAREREQKRREHERYERIRKLEDADRGDRRRDVYPRRSPPDHRRWRR